MVSGYCEYYNCGKFTEEGHIVTDKDSTPSTCLMCDRCYNFYVGLNE